jgi:hypothetical protein
VPAAYFLIAADHSRRTERDASQIASPDAARAELKLP